MSYNCPIHIKNGKVIDENMTIVEKILHSKKLNYKDLKEISDPYFKDNKCETINIFIDLFDILKQLYSPQLIEEFKTIRTTTKMNMISEIINIVGHYRHFFVTRYNKFTTIVLYYSTKEDSYLKTINPDYKKDFYNKRLIKEKNSEFYVVNKVINDCLTVVKEYLNYIPHAYLVDTGNIDPRYFNYLIKKEIDVSNAINPNDYTIIMTNNKLSLLDLNEFDNTIIFKNNYNSKYFINKEQIFDELELENNTGLPTDIIKYLFALSGNKDINMKNINKMRDKKAFKFIRDNDYRTLEKNIEIFKTIDDYKLFKNNLLLLNYKSYPFSEFKKAYIKEQIIDISDFEYIKQETFNIFDSSCVVLFDYLFDGEEII